MAELQEVVVIDAVRSPIGKSGRKGMEKGGQLCQASAQDLLASVMRSLLDRVKAKAPNFDEKEIEDVVVGCLSQIGEQGANIARIASLLAGIPNEASAYTVNQYCNSGLKGINSATRAIKCGDGDIWVCAGVELMSHYGMGSDVQVAMEAQYPVRFTDRIQESGMTVPQGVCAEMISADYGHTRDDLDKFGMWSMQKSVEARRKGWHDDLIVPVEFEWEGQNYRAEKDETIRDKAVENPEGYWEDMQKLGAPFKPDGGMVTAGNSSQIVDGASAVLLMNAKKAEALGLEPMCRVTACASAGGEPVPMLLAPIPACEKAMKRAGLKIDDFDILEPNEAFASPLLVFAKELGYAVDDPRINPTGGAIGMGHPIGASGVLWFSEMVHHLRRINGKAGMQMMCGGGGIGIATIVEAV
mgnify:CR=1 FL=1|jgi:acetyl-CoA acyltransferase